MAFDLNGLIFSISAYILGSIPFGLVVSRLCGAQDPREAGSGNIGSTNVLRLSGKKIGTLTLFGDLGKGWVIGFLAGIYFSENIWGLIAVFLVVLGHIFPVFLKFRGGKGVATGLGGILGLNPLIGIILIALWAGAVAFWKYSSGGALLAFGLFPLISVLVLQKGYFFHFSVILSCLIIFKHKGNIERLINGTESKVGSGSI